MNRVLLILNISFWPIEGALKGITTPSHIAFWSNDNERVTPHSHDLQNQNLVIRYSLVPSFFGRVSYLQKGCTEYNSKLYQMVMLQFRRFEGCGVPLHCHKSQVHFDPEHKYLLGSKHKSNRFVGKLFILDWNVIPKPLLSWHAIKINQSINQFILIILAEIIFITIYLYSFLFISP